MPFLLFLPQKLASDDMLLHFSNLSMQMDGSMVLKKVR